MNPTSEDSPLRISLRDCQEISRSTTRQKLIVPVAMELFPSKLKFGHLLVGNSEALLIDISVDLAFYGQAGRRCGCGDEVNDDLVADQRLAAPVLADEREQAMLDLVPFTGTRREMTD